MPSDIVVVGEPTQVEINGKRFYKVVFSDGSCRMLRSVTTICKGAQLPSFLDTWKMQQVEALGIKGFEAAMNQVANDGTELHRLIENHCNGFDEYAVDDDVRRMYEGYLRWEEKNKPETIWQEKTLYSLQYGYAGRADKKATLKNGRTCIIDYKSAKAVRPEHKEQGSAYLIADSEMKHEPAADSVLVLALGPENKQGFSECWLDTPYKITQHFMSFNMKNTLVSFHNPSF
jgi:hypothetical protein